eukprot:3324921-Rhodomonas_salina.2
MPCSLARPCSRHPVLLHSTRGVKRYKTRLHLLFDLAARLCSHAGRRREQLPQPLRLQCGCGRRSVREQRADQPSEQPHSRAEQRAPLTATAAVWRLPARVPPRVPTQYSRPRASGPARGRRLRASTECARLRARRRVLRSAQPDARRQDRLRALQPRRRRPCGAA